MSTDWSSRPTAPSAAGQLHLAGHGFAMTAAGGLDVQVGQIDADLVNLAPEATRALQPGGFDLRVKSAEIRLDPATLARFLAAKVPGLEHVTLAFEAPDRVTVAGKLGNDAFSATGRLVADGGRLGFLPTRIEGPATGLKAALSPQTGRIEASVGDHDLLTRLAPALAKAGIQRPTIALHPGNLVDVTATKTLAGKPANFAVTAALATSADGRVALQAKNARLSWDGLEAEGTAARAHGHTTTVALNRWLARSLPAKQVRNVSVSVQPGNRAVATMQVLDGRAWRPLSVSGQLDVTGGAVRFTPERVKLENFLGGVDIDVNPVSGQGRAQVSEAALNQALAPVFRQNGLERAHVRLLPNNQLELTGVKPDGQGRPQPLMVRGHLTLAGPDELRITPQHLELGGRVLDMDSLGAGILHMFGWHLDHEIALKSPAAAMEGDVLVIHPSRLPAPLGARLDSLVLDNGRLVASGKFLGSLKDVWHDPGRVELHGNTLLIHPQAISPQFAGRFTGLRTGNGTLDVDAAFTPADWQHMIKVRVPGVELQGSEVRLDIGQLTGLGGAKVTGISTAGGAATVQMRGDPKAIAGHVPDMAGLHREGTTWLLDPKQAGLPLSGPVTAIRTDAKGVTIDVGQPGPLHPGSGLEGQLSGHVAIDGVTIEDAVVGLALPPDAAPVSLDALPKAHLRVDAARVTVPASRVKQLLAQYVPADKLGGYQLAWTGKRLALSGRYLGMAVRGELSPAAGYQRGLALEPVGFHWGPVPIPGWLAARLVGGKVNGTVDRGRVYLDAGKLVGATLGPVTSLTVTADGVAVTIGRPAAKGPAR